MYTGVVAMHLFMGLAPVVQTLDSAIHWINHYPPDKYLEKLIVLLHWIEIYPVDSTIHILNNSGLAYKQ